MNTQHVWTIYQIKSDTNQTHVEECSWRYERFSDEKGKELEQIGKFILATPLTMEEFAKLGYEEQRDLIASNVDTNAIELS